VCCVIIWIYFPAWLRRLLIVGVIGMVTILLTGEKTWVSNKRGVPQKGGSYREQLTLERCASAAAAPPITAEIITMNVIAAPHARRAVRVATGGDIWRGFLQMDCGGGGDEDDGDDGGDRPRLSSDAALCPLMTVIPDPRRQPQSGPVPPLSPSGQQRCTHRRCVVG
jgi:hypothetical protein